MDTAAHLATVKFEEGCKMLKQDAKQIADIKRRSLLVTIGQMKNEFQKLQIRYGKYMTYACRIFRKLCYADV